MQKHKYFRPGEFGLNVSNVTNAPTKILLKLSLIQITLVTLRILKFAEWTHLVYQFIHNVYICIVMFYFIYIFTRSFNFCRKLFLQCLFTIFAEIRASVSWDTSSHLLRLHWFQTYKIDLCFTF